MTEKPKPSDKEGTGPPEPVSSVNGPLPLDHLDNDYRFNPDTDTSPGSQYDDLGKLISQPAAPKKK